MADPKERIPFEADFLGNQKGFSLPSSYDFLGKSIRWTMSTKMPHLKMLYISNFEYLMRYLNNLLLYD